MSDYKDSWICADCENPVPNTYKSACPICKVPRPMGSTPVVPEDRATIELPCLMNPLYQDMMRGAREAAETPPDGVTPAQHAVALARKMSAHLHAEVVTQKQTEADTKAEDDKRREEWRKMDRETARKLGLPNMDAPRLQR